MSSLPSTLEAVTVYREGATCRRRAEIPAGVDRQVRLGGLPLSLEPGSVRARVIGGSGRVVDVRAQFDVRFAAPADTPQELQARDAAAEALEALQTERARLDREIAELESLQPQYPEQKPGAPPRAAPVEAILALSEFRDAQLAERHRARRELEPRLRDAQQEYTLRQQRLAEASSAKRGETAQLERVVVVTLAEPPREGLQLELEYAVPGARWVPNYTLTLDRSLSSGTLTMRASVAQHTGEDWSRVSLSLSTAEAKRRADLPELKALKIGRRQDEPPRSGWREPPPGLDDLFQGYDAAIGQALVKARPVGGRAERHEEVQRRVLEAADELERGLPSRVKKMVAPPPPAPRLAAPAPPPPPAPASMAAPAPQRSGGAPMRSRKEVARADDLSDEFADEGAFDEGVLGGSFETDEITGSFRAPGITLRHDVSDYSRLTLQGPEAGARRGRLAPAPQAEFAVAAGLSVEVSFIMQAVLMLEAQATGVLQLPLPAQCSPVASVRSFDYRYDCAARADIPSTGKWTQVQVMECAVGLSAEYVCVPSVEPKVYRTLTVSNRSSHALLPGPVDVSAGDEFLMTTQLPAIPPGAAESHRLGLGVEESIKVSRKTQMKETTGGFLGGSTVLPHDVDIELNNRLATPALIEVRERVPVPEGHEKDLKVEEVKVEPPWERVETPIDGRVVSGARRWRVTVPPGQSFRLAAQYAIRMPADRMLVGGNRRD